MFQGQGPKIDAGTENYRKVSEILGLPRFPQAQPSLVERDGGRSPGNLCVGDSGWGVPNRAPLEGRGERGTDHLTPAAGCCHLAARATSQGGPPRDHWAKPKAVCSPWGLGCGVPCRLWGASLTPFSALALAGGGPGQRDGRVLTKSTEGGPGRRFWP